MGLYSQVKWVVIIKPTGYTVKLMYFTGKPMCFTANGGVVTKNIAEVFYYKLDSFGSLTLSVCYAVDRTIIYQRF
jgi:hypothetical protein